MNNGNEVPSVKISEGLSVFKILLFLIVVVALGAGGIFLVARHFITSSNFSMQIPEISIPKVSLPENPIGDISQLGDLGSLVEKAADSISKSLENAQIAHTGDTGFRSVGYQVQYKVEGRTLTVTVGGGQSYTFQSDPDEPRAWIGAIHDPYSPLVNLAGTPFFSGEGLPIQPADNIVKITDETGAFVMNDDSFKMFPFFSEKPTSIGIAEGYYDMATMTARLRLTFFDTERPVATQVNSEEMAFPQWFKKGGYPPAFATQKYLRLPAKENWYGANVYSTLMKFTDADYEFSSDAFFALSKRELAKVPPTPEDIAVLRKTDLNSSEFSEASMYAVQRFVAYAYYCKITKQQQTVKVLLSQMHKSIQKAFSQMPELSVE